jgi:hypothetical protein
MAATWKLRRISQCPKCPWIVGVDPHDIPDGYCETKHRTLAATIATPGKLDLPGESLQVMACHETNDAHCVGWLTNQLGAGNNIPLRIRMMTCENAGKLRLRGAQHARFEDTLPEQRALPREMARMRRRG